MRQTRPGQARPDRAGTTSKGVSGLAQIMNGLITGVALHLRLQCLTDVYIPMLTTHFFFCFHLLHLLHPHRSFSSVRSYRFIISIISTCKLFHPFTLYTSTVLFLAHTLCNGLMSVSRVNYLHARHRPRSYPSLRSRLRPRLHPRPCSSSSFFSCSYQCSTSTIYINVPQQSSLPIVHPNAPYQLSSSLILIAILHVIL